MNKAIDSIVYPGSNHLYQNVDASVLGSQPVLPCSDPLAKAYDFAYIMFQRRDLAAQKSFLLDFGLTLVKEENDRLYFRSNNQSPFCYLVERGEKDIYLGSAFLLRERQELEKLSDYSGSPIVNCTTPGGGSKVTLTDPSGFRVDVIQGWETVAAISSRQTLLDTNTPWHKPRVNRGQRTELAPSPVEKVGHVVLGTPAWEENQNWYMKHLGLIPTDVLCAHDGTPVLAFNRFDRGAELTDHHSLVIGTYTQPKYLHSAYETIDQDAIGQGQQFLKMKGWNHFWGIGRHILGSQIFDYWLDPAGEEHEHYADGDVFDNTYETQYHFFDRGGLWQWGVDVPDDLRPKPNLKDMKAVIQLLLKGQWSMEFIKKVASAGGKAPRPWLK